MRALSARWPGSLRELERVSPDEIARRLDALGGRREDEFPAWARCLARYHRAMRLALALRSAVPSREAAAVRAWAESDEGRGALPEEEARALDDGTITSLLRPPSGRLHVAVLAWLGRIEGRDVAEEIDALLGGASRAQDPPSKPHATRS